MARITWIVLVLVIVVLVGGCASKKKPTQREQAHRQWNAARANVLFGLAKGQYELGNFDRSQRTVNEALALDPENANLYILSAKLAIEQGRLEVAERHLKLARQFAPHNAEAEYLSGVVFQRWQQPQTAYDFYTQAHEKAPAELAYLLARAEMLVFMDRPHEALAMLQERVIYFEHSAVIRDAVGQLLMQEGRYREAVEMFRQASILAVDDLTIREHLGLALYYNGQHREAAHALMRLMGDERYGERADLLVALGECQMHLGQLREARANFEKATQLEPAVAGYWLSLGKASVALNDFRRADFALRRAQALQPQNPETHLMMGFLRLRQQSFEESLRAFRRAHALDPNDTVSLCMIGYVLERTGDVERAMEHYGRALQISPDDKLAMKLMAGATD